MMQAFLLRELAECNHVASLLARQHELSEILEPRMSAIGIISEPGQISITNIVAIVPLHMCCCNRKLCGGGSRASHQHLEKTVSPK